MFSFLSSRDGAMRPPPMSRTDAHCHILPGLDDGSRNDRDSLAMARILSEMGVRRVVATPHVISDVFQNSTSGIMAAVERLRRLFDASGLSLEVVAGAEYYAEPAFLDRIDRGDLVSAGEERHVLFESSMESAPMILEEIVFRLIAAGYTPLLAHVERYRFLQRDFGAVMRLRELGTRFQINHRSFFLPRTNRRGDMARRLYARGLVDALGSDLHRAGRWAGA